MNGPAMSPPRLGLLGLAGAALLAGLTGALVLLGLSMPADTARLAAAHGLLMTLGFLGTLIALERAVALDRHWGYLAPLAAGFGGVSLIAGLPVVLSAVLLAVGGAVFVAMYVAFDRIERSLHTSVQAVGALAWLVAALLLVAGRPVSAVVPWLAAFLVLTIAGERLELSRLVRLSDRARHAFIGATAMFSAGVVATLVAPDAGMRLAGAGLLALAAWLARNDVARRTVRTPGVTRFVALSLLAGYAWLAVAGAFWLTFGSTGGGPAFDTMLHAIFLGFVISMVFGHAPVILPAVLRTPLPYHPGFYAHLGLLHAGLLLRIVGGDMLGSTVAWQAGGILNVSALLLFVVSSMVAIVSNKRPRLAPPGLRPLALEPQCDQTEMETRIGATVAMNIRIKRAYEAPAEDDGYRILVDRVWPRGRSRQDLRIDEWARDVAPGTDLRRWFGHQPERWEAFRDRYRRELAAADRVAELHALLVRVGSKSLTLVYGARDTEHNQAVVLAEVLRDLVPPAP